MTKSYATKEALTRPENNSKVTPKQLQENIKKETLELNYAHEKRWKKFKHWAKIIILFGLFPIAVLLLLITWFVSFLVINWGNPQAIMNQVGWCLSYVFTAIISSVVTHYVEKN